MIRPLFLWPFFYSGFESWKQRPRIFALNLIQLPVSEDAALFEPFDVICNGAGRRICTKHNL